MTLEEHDLVSPSDIVRSGLCIGCGSCASSSNGRLSMSFDPHGQLKPDGDRATLASPNVFFSKTCPFSPRADLEDEIAADLFPDAPVQDAAIGRYHSAYVGSVAAGDYRTKGSSGGLVTWAAAELMRHGFVDAVAHVTAVDDPQSERSFFRYRVSRTEDQVRAGAKSRYYPIELSAVLDEIRNTPGRYAVVGVPCFIKAIQLLRRNDPLIRERVRFTLGLFCGHMKSARFVESFAWQLGVPIERVRAVEFRHKDASRPANWYTARLTLDDGAAVQQDWWHLCDGDWGAGYFMNSACNYCDDVVAETADISFGDAWVEPYSSDGRGTNVVVVRSKQLDTLVRAAIDEGRLDLSPVDSDFVVQTQAAGLRQRREGLAYRLTWSKRGLVPVKRVIPDRNSPTARRKLIYRMRYLISALSHRVFSLARRLGRPAIYIKWANASAAVYHGLAYSRGRIGAIVDKLKILGAG